MPACGARQASELSGGRAPEVAGGIVAVGSSAALVAPSMRIARGAPWFARRDETGSEATMLTVASPVLPLGGCLSVTRAPVTSDDS